MRREKRGQLRYMSELVPAATGGEDAQPSGYPHENRNHRMKTPAGDRIGLCNAFCNGQICALKLTYPAQ